MWSNPEQFDHFKLLYSLSLQRSLRGVSLQFVNRRPSASTASLPVNWFLLFYRNLVTKKKFFWRPTTRRKCWRKRLPKFDMDTIDDSEVASPDTELHIYNNWWKWFIATLTPIKIVWHVLIWLINCLSNFLLFADLRKSIGYADVKSAPVYFDVQRNSTFSHTNHTQSTPISFELARVNEGNAMDLASGKFTAPRPGIYFISFTGHLRSSDPSPYFFTVNIFFFWTGI
jgi:hypothetical protein